MYPVMGKKRLGRVKSRKVFKEKSERYITHLGTDGCHKKVFPGGIYVVCYITSRDGGVTRGDFRWYRCRRDPGTV